MTANQNHAVVDRRWVLTSCCGGLTAVAGCAGNENDENGTSDQQETNNEEPTEDFEILNARLNSETLDEYDVNFPADATPEQLADEFRHQLEYDTQGASGTVESTIGVEYTDRTIPNTPLNEEIESDQYQDTETIEQEVEFPEHLIENLIENPRNIQAKLTAEDTETGQKQDREFTLNYADEYAENVHKAAFDEGDLELSDAELENTEVNNGVVNLKYNSDHEIGSEEFNSELTAVGLYTSIIESTRINYELDLTVKDKNGEEYSQNVGTELPEKFLNGEITHGDLRREVYFNEVRIDRD